MACETICTFFYVFLKIQKKHDFLRYLELLHTFSRTVIVSMLVVTDKKTVQTEMYSHVFYMAVGSGPAGPVLAGPIVFKVQYQMIVGLTVLRQLLRKSIKLLPPELHLLAQICSESFVGWGFAPDPTGELTALPRPPSWIKGAYF